MLSTAVDFGNTANPATEMNYFLNNVVWAGNNNGITLRRNDLGNITFKNNIIQGDDWHVNKTTSGAGSYLFDYNLYPSDSKLYDGAAKTLATWRTSTGYDNNSQTPADPLFVSAGSDFHLQSGSPAINAGVDVGLTEDYAGNAIVGVPDIGAYEYQPTSGPGSPGFGYRGGMGIHWMW
jgi:hypothetical protein